MLFTSTYYLFFLPLVVIGYFLITHKWRWLWLLTASYLFYVSWQPIYALLILGSTALDFFAARAMGAKANKKERKPLLYLSLLGNLGSLFVFKYLGFFNDLLRDLADFTSIEYSPVVSLVFPVGISFYTFQSLSYTIDVYRGNRKSEKHFGVFALYVSFFPQLLAGPIERSQSLIPQFHIAQRFNWTNIFLGLRLILWGVFKKVVLADKIGHYVNTVYSTPEEYHGFTYIFISCAFLLQVLFDFGAYTDIAIGSAKLFGYDLSINFNRPFHSKSIREFWQRWHMSLTTWFFEYLYKPLSRKLRAGWKLNILVFMIIIGFWHGPTWGFLIFGILHGLLYVLSEFAPVFEHKKNKKTDRLLKVLAMIGVFFLVSITTIFFRAETFSDATYALYEAISGFYYLNNPFVDLAIRKTDLFIVLANLILYFSIQNLPKHNPKDPLAAIPFRWMRWGLYYYLIFMIISLAHTQMQEFIYFHL